MFVALRAVDHVGATIGRPRKKCCEFALDFGKFATDNRSGRVAERSESK